MVTSISKEVPTSEDGDSKHSEISVIIHQRTQSQARRLNPSTPL
jgi:hypothetical protein